MSKLNMEGDLNYERLAKFRQSVVQLYHPCEAYGAALN